MGELALKNSLSKVKKKEDIRRREEEIRGGG